MLKIMLILMVFVGYAGAEEAKAPPLTYPGEMVVKILDPDGKPLAGVKIKKFVALDKRKPSEPPRPCPFTTDTTNQEGIFKIALPHEPQFIDFYIKDTRYVPVHAEWHCVDRIKRAAASLSPNDKYFKYSSAWEAQMALNGPIEKMPAYYTIQMKKGFVIGGRIVNEQGQPVSGAVVKIGVGRGPVLTGALVTRPYLHGDDASTISDADGRWLYDRITDQIEYGPLVRDKQPDFRIEHPDYETPEEHFHRDGNMFEYTEPWDELRNQTSEIILKYRRPSK